MPKSLTREQLPAQAHARTLYVLLKYMQRGNPFSLAEDPGRGERWTDSDKRTITIEIDGPVYDDLYFEMARWREVVIALCVRQRP
jgi:hypothetical protein